MHQNKSLRPLYFPLYFLLYFLSRNLNDVERTTVFYHFMLHEFFHLGQGISSYRYHYTDYAPRALLRVDYYADAVAALALYELYRQFHPPGWVPEPSWNRNLARLIRLAVLDMEVFTAFEHAYPLQSISWFSFRRYLQWHFQYARARQYGTDTGTLESFNLLETPDLVLGGIDAQDALYRTDTVFTKPQLLVIGWKAKLHEFSSEVENFAGHLVDAVLRGDLESSNRLFADAFFVHPNLVGR